MIAHFAQSRGTRQTDACAPAHRARDQPAAQHASTGGDKAVASLRNLVLVLGDQLDRGLSALDSFDTDRDAVWMAENDTEAMHVWCHKQRLALFFSAMRHHRDALLERGLSVY